MNADQIATLVYGALATMLVALFAAVFQSRTGMALACIGAGLTWAFQTVQMATQGEQHAPWFEAVLFFAAPAVLVLAFLVTAFGA